MCRITELKDALELAQQELETMRDDNKRRMGMVESVVRQRDMYRSMLASTGGDGDVTMAGNVSMCQTSVFA